MKTAAKALLAILVGLGLGIAVPAVAQGQATAAVSLAPAAGVGTGGALPSQPTTDSLPKMAASSSSVAMSDIRLPSSSDPKDKGGKHEVAKVPDSVNNVVKRLNTATEDVTLEDLNSAREAVAKLDILIDIEKRLSDLASIRQEREEKSVDKALAGAIPASALGMRGKPAPAAEFPVFSVASAPPPPPPAPLPPVSVDVERITGATGHYVALIRGTDGKRQQVREGEKLSDGSIVEKITEQGITLRRDKKKNTFQIKNVGPVFGVR